MSKNTVNLVIRGTISIMIVGVLAKVASFISEAILAAALGTSAVGDAYYMVANIQAVIFPMLNIGIWNVFLPLYKTHIAKGELQEAYGLADRSISFFTLASIAIVALLLVFAETVVSIVAPGFEGSTKELCVTLVRIAAPKYCFITASAVYASMLQCHNRFVGSQIREVASHIPTIIAALFLYERFGIRILAVALVAGGMLRLLIELPFVNWGYHYRPNLHFKSAEFKEMLRRMPPVLLTEATVQVNALIDKAMASTLPDGTISGMNYGHKLVNVVSGLLSVSVATALYPQMIELIAQKKREELSNLVVRILRLFCALMLPVTLACILFSRELVTAVFRRGAFNMESVSLTAGVFAMYSVGLLFYASNTVLNNLFYSSGDTKTPFYVSLAAMGINICLNLCLIRLLGANGLAMATALSSISVFCILLVLSRRIISFPWRGLLLAAGKILLCAGAACIPPRVLFWLVPGQNVFLVLAASALFGVAVYLLGLKITRVEELDTMKKLLTQKLRKRV